MNPFESESLETVVDPHRSIKYPIPSTFFCVAINIINILKDETQLIERRRKMDEQQKQIANRADSESIDNL